ncbi:MAG TPA: 2-oxoacid:ferredoxin oxidoreductase subunit beta [Bacteroidetes bacterium]|nr:2-oxoacid:ferredoxin oxidoreductase subunit beta [Bacteroidota bacterium]
MSRALAHWLRGEHTAFCPGCGHGILLGSLVRALEELAVDRRRLVLVSGIGCAAWIPSPHIEADTLHTTHGRPVAFATGVALANPELKVVVVSGDGDLTAIGGNHLVHAARRNVPMTVICANNHIYGMTGGQAAPTTPEGCYTQTSPWGQEEPPFDLCRLVEGAGAGFIGRHTVFQIHPLIKLISRALLHEGFSFIEAVSPCPTHYGKLNRIPTLGDFRREMKGVYLNRRKWEKLPESEREGKVPTGEWVRP